MMSGKCSEHQGYQKNCPVCEKSIAELKEAVIEAAIELRQHDSFENVSSKEFEVIYAKFASATDALIAAMEAERSE
jgi:hypothetical protein